MFIIFVRELGPNLSLANLTLPWKMATPLSHVFAKQFLDLTLLHIDTQLLFLHCHAAIYVPASGCKTDQPPHHTLQICFESHPNVNICPVFYLKAYLHCTKPFGKILNGS